MEYRLYNKNGLCLGIGKSVEDAKEYFGQIYDKCFAHEPEDANLMKVEVIVDKGKRGQTKFAEYSITDFLNKEIVVHAATPMTKELYSKLSDPKNLEDKLPDFKSEDSREFEERAKAFDDDEYRTVLKYVPTGFILGELMRRFDEYNKATDGIASLLDNMKIYNKE